MGMPACRIGDLTEHGGTIMVGFPTVLIGDMPASRIGDMHVCPMVTPGVPPIPHVGGPFVLGSPTVLVGMMPQSRVTDTLVCVGPPDQAVLGCMTVLVGMAGGAGAAGAASGAAAMGVAVPAPAPGSTADSDSSTAAPARTKATMQPDGSIQTASTAPGAPLPPIPLKQPGWPDLPPDDTATFSSVQPATVLPGTQLYAAGDAYTGSENNYWTSEPPGAGSGVSGGAPEDGEVSQRTSKHPISTTIFPAILGLPVLTHVAVLTITAAAGLKAWAGQGANGAAGLQVWAPVASAQAAGSRQTFRLPAAPKLPEGH